MSDCLSIPIKIGSPSCPKERRKNAFVPKISINPPFCFFFSTLNSCGLIQTFYFLGWRLCQYLWRHFQLTKVSDYCHLKSCGHLHVPARSPQSVVGGRGGGVSKSSRKQSSQGNLSVDLGPPRSPSPMFRERTSSPSTAPKSCGLINSCPQPDFPVALSAHSCPGVSWEQRSKRAEPRVLLHSKKRLCGIFGGTVLSQENQFAVISSIPLRRLSLYVHLGSRLESL